MTKISLYPAKTVFNDTDLFDCSTAGITSEKMTFAQLKTELNSALGFVNNNLYEGDGTLTDPRTVNQNSHYINFTDGNFGIGIIPATNFHLLGTGRIDGTLQIGDITTTGFAFPTATGTLGQVMEVDASGDLVFGTNLNGIYSGSGSLSGATTITQASNNLTLSTTGDANTLQVDATNGRLGVNIAAPLEPLHVNGNARVDGNHTVQNIGHFGAAKVASENPFRIDTYLINNAINVENYGGSTAYMNLSANTQLTVGGAAQDAVKLLVFGATSDSTKDVLQLMDSSATSLHRFVNDGNVSLCQNGTSSCSVGGIAPLEMFHVNGNIRADGDYVVNGNAGFTGTGAYTNFTIEGGIITAAS